MNAPADKLLAVEMADVHGLTPTRWLPAVTAALEAGLTRFEILGSHSPAILQTMIDLRASRADQPRRSR